jgi:hypothetical protein
MLPCSLARAALVGQAGSDVEAHVQEVVSSRSAGAPIRVLEDRSQVGPGVPGDALA